MKKMWTPLVLILLLLIFVPRVQARLNTTEKDFTEATLDIYFLALSDFKKQCGRYPTTAEGIQAFVIKPTDLACSQVNYAEITGYKNNSFLMRSKDGWKEPIIYKSNGKTFRVTASHGYYLTEKSPNHDKSGHWSNPSPPAEPPGFDCDPDEPWRCPKTQTK